MPHMVMRTIHGKVVLLMVACANAMGCGLPATIDPDDKCVTDANGFSCPLARLERTGYPPDRKIRDFAKIFHLFWQPRYT